MYPSRTGRFPITSPPIPSRRIERTHGGAASLSPVEFPALEFGIAPNTIEATDTTQLLGLLVARQALDDAGYDAHRSLDRDRVSVILGVTGTLELVIPLAPGWVTRSGDARCRRPGSTNAPPRMSSAASPNPTWAGRRTRSPASWGMLSPAGSPIAWTFAAPTVSSMPPAPARSGPSTSPSSNSPPADATSP